MTGFLKVAELDRPMTSRQCFPCEHRLSLLPDSEEAKLALSSHCLPLHCWLKNKQTNNNPPKYPALWSLV